MGSIKLEKNEVETMKSFYREELKKTLDRLEHIKDVLEKLGDSQNNIQIKISSRANFAPSSAPRTTPRKRKGKPGPDSVWEKKVLKRLKLLDRPLTYEELTDEIMNMDDHPAENRKKIKQSVINVTFRLRKRDGKIDTFSNGSREKYLALSSWFGADGQIDSKYRSRIKTSSVSKSTKSSGTKAKKAAPVKKAKKAATGKKKVAKKRTVARAGKKVAQKTAAKRGRPAATRRKSKGPLIIKNK